MASSGGKKVKTKWKPMSVDELYTTSSGPQKITWAEEVDRELDVDSSEFSQNKPTTVVLPTAPRASRLANIDESKIPNSGPYHAYVSNIPYEMNENELSAIFKDLKIKSVKLPRDEKGGNKAKGFGYIEFEDRASLIAALNQSETIVKGRSVHIEIASNVEGGGRGGGSRGGGRGPRDSGSRDNTGPDRTTTNWRSGPRAEEFEDRGYDRGQFSGRREFSSGFREDQGRFARSDRSFGGEDRFREGGGFSSSRDERYGKEDRSFSRYEERRDRDSRFPSKRDERSEPPKSSGGEPKVRTKLNLKPRTSKAESEAPSGAQSSIFGGARPVDTSARDREIEERLAKNNEEHYDARGRNFPVGTRDKGREWSEERKSEQPTPPKENVWTHRRTNPSASINNGRSSPEEERSDNVDQEERDRSNENRLDPSEPRRLESKHSENVRDKGGCVSRDAEQKEWGKESDRQTNKQRESGKVIEDELSRMPQVQGTTRPNFAGENKFSSLVPEEGVLD